MSRDKLFEKAQKLANSRRVESIGPGVFNVIGDHGTYTVVQDYQGKFSCTCPGFISKGKCSHIGAVILLISGKRRR